ncbi:hypothetical protein K0M31_001863 [Melipona bicolor]|uniref:Uncharacterized protein n=1 Tax=Melipona bicolor TaxID=60889 RepID=A0AA40GGD4_9HYME|nr:hypothetical protein K0M31_001863 [Melipona bicolor]
MAVTGLKIIIQRAAWAEFAFPRHGTLLPAIQPASDDLQQRNGSRNRIQKAATPVEWKMGNNVENANARTTRMRLEKREAACLLGEQIVADLKQGERLV